MNRRVILSLSAITACGAALFPSHAISQQKSLREQLVGTWIYVSSSVTRADGSKSERPNLKGVVTYTADGHFFFMTTRADLPKLASMDATKPTPEEAMAVASGSIAYYGIYSLDEVGKVIMPQVEGSTFANLTGAPNLSRNITSLSDNELRFTNPRTQSGLVLEFVWKRAK